MQVADLDHAIELMTGTLQPLVARDWSVRAGTVDWDCRTTLAHIGHDLIAYAAQVAGQPQTAYLPFDLVVRDGAGPAETLAVARTCGALLASALRTAGPQMRAWHFGPCDATGFIALGVAEILIHTYDITQGLKVKWHPPAQLCAGVLARLAPHVPSDRRHPTGVLLRYTGRFGDSGPWKWRIRAP